MEKETGLSYAALAAQVRELTEERQELTDTIGDLEAREKRSIELKAEIGENEKRLSELSIERSRLEAEVSSLNSFIQKRSQALGIPPVELEAKLGELVDLDADIANKRSERNRLLGELQALSERHQKLSAQMDKASADFARDVKLIGETMKELV